MSIAKNNIETNIHLQTSRSLDRVKQDMLLVTKTIHAQPCCASNGKMKVKKVADKYVHDERSSVGEKTKLTYRHHELFLLLKP